MNKILFFLERLFGGYIIKLRFMRKCFLPIHRKLKSVNMWRAIKRVRGKTPCNLDMRIFNSAIKQIRKMQIKDKLAGIGGV